MNAAKASRSWRAALATLSLVATTLGAAHLAPERAAARPPPTATVAAVGDVILGGSANAIAAKRGPDHLMGRLEPLQSAQLALANLESVATTGGERTEEKSEPVPFHFRARPETLGVVAAAGIDVVATANNHSGDYGVNALLDQGTLLDGMGLLDPGSGPNQAEACAPVYADVTNGIRVAVFSADATEPSFAAGPESAGTCHLPPDDLEAWDDQFEVAIAEARADAHAVLFAIHWGAGWEDRPTDETRALGRRLVELGVDAVLGSNAHTLQGIERFGDGVILYDTAHALALFDRAIDSAIFTLTLTTDGITSVDLHPIVADTTHSRMATASEATRIIDRVASLSAEFGTVLTGSRLELTPAVGAAREPTATGPASPIPAAVDVPDPAAAPPPGCEVDAVPAAARLDPVRIGPLTLVGAEAIEDRQVLPGLVEFDTYWRIEGDVDADLQLNPHGLSGGHEVGLWQSNHEPCDWAWPTSRWRPAAIYRDSALLRPPPTALSVPGAASLASGVRGSLEISVAVEADGAELGRSDIVASVDLGAPLPVTVAVLVLAASGVGLAGAVFVLRRRRRRRVA